MSFDALPKTRAALEAGRADGLHHGAQIFVSHRGETVCDAAVGEARPGEPLTADHLMLWLSAGKPVTAAAVLACCEDFPNRVAPDLSLDDLVGKHIPGFEANGKGGVTVRHLLTHTAGLPEAAPGYPDVNWDESIRRLCDAPLADGWVVGRTAGYHPKASWFLLGEIVRRAKGDFEGWIAETIDECDAWTLRFSQAPEDFAEGWAARRIAPMYRRTGGGLEDAGLSDERHLTRPSPGSSLRTTAGHLGAFYLDLLDALKHGDGPFLSTMAAEAMTARHRVGEFDRTLGHVVDFGLGVIVDSNRYGADTVPYGFGPHCSPRTFGHGGSQSSMAFCDPENGLVVAWATNGMCGEPKHQNRNRAINAAIYEDLGLA